MVTLASFGCSFMYGSELPDRSQTWPGLIADQLHLAHENHGIEGAGNLRILERIMAVSRADVFCIVNWTWIDRFDYVDISDESWQTILPTDRHAQADFYYRKFHSQYRDMLTNLIWVKSAVDYLERLGASYLMTYMDPLMFEQVRDDWHDSRPVSHLQQAIKPRLHTFQGQTFLQWSRQHGFAESTRWHPLDQAHHKAAELMLPIVQDLLYSKNNRS